MSKAVITKVKESLKEKLPQFLNISITKGEKVSGRNLRIVMPRTEEEFSKFCRGMVDLVRDMLDICNLGAICHNPSGLVTYDVHKMSGRPVARQEVKDKIISAMSLIPLFNETPLVWWDRMKSSGYDYQFIQEEIAFLPEQFRKTVVDMYKAMVSESNGQPDHNVSIPVGVSFEEIIEAVELIPVTELEVEKAEKIESNQGNYLEFLNEKAESDKEEYIEQQSGVSLTQVTYRCVACGYSFTCPVDNDNDNEICPECGVGDAEEIQGGI